MNKKISQRIWILTTLIIGFGLVGLYSASFENVRVSQKVFYDQLYCAGVGFVIMYLLSRFDFRHFYDAAYVLYGINVLMLLAVLFMGKHALGATRWLNIGGLNFQPSELTKISLILLLARYYADRRHHLVFGFFSRLSSIWHDMGLPLLLTLFPMYLIFKQPDLGTSLLMMGIFLTVAFAAHIRKSYILGFLGICLAIIPFGWAFLRDYQKDRLLVFLNPNIDPLGAGYTIIQSKIAVGSGQLWGKGWLSGTQNQLNFLPERHTDFIFSVLGEEWGFLGGMFMIVLFLLLIHTSLNIAEQVKDKFGALVTVGIVSILTLQVIINIGMVMGLFPIVGLTLPFVSYGRTSFMIFVLMIGFLLNLSRKRTIF